MKMVDVGAKPPTERVAVATGRVRMRAETLERIRTLQVEKGNVVEAARLAAVMGAKRTPDLVPLCHPLSLSGVAVEVALGKDAVEIRVEVKTVDRTGVEMEALTAVCAAALTVYDMLKSGDRGMRIEKVQLEHKRGGRTGVWNRSPIKAPARPAGPKLPEKKRRSPASG